MAGYWSRLQNVSNIWGMPKALLIGLGWMLCREFKVYCLDLDKLPPDLKPGLNLRWTSFREPYSAVLLKMNPGMSPEKLHENLDNGQKCLLGWQGKKLMHCRWETDVPMHLDYLDLDFCPLPGDVLSLGAFTSPEARGMGVYSASTIKAAQRAKRRGYKRFIVQVAKWNLPPLATQEKRLRSKKAGTIKYFPWLPGDKHRLTGDMAWDSKGRLYLF
jgi:hypothetical protein